MGEETFVDPYGVEIFSRWWPVDEPRGVVLIAHGASEHSGRYDRFARALNAAGFAAAGLDHRGHGRTAPTMGAAVTGPGGGDAVIADLDALRARAVDRVAPGTPVFLFGHSLGSLIAFGYLARHAGGLAGAVLCAVPANVDDVAALGVLLRGFADAGQRDQPVENLLTDNNTAFEPARTPYDWLSRDPAEVDRYVADPMCGDDNPLTYGYLVDLFDVVAPARERLGAISVPVLVIAGDQDPAAAMGDHAETAAAALTAAGVDTQFVLYPGARHELLNETNRDEVTADLVEWLSAHA